MKYKKIDPVYYPTIIDRLTRFEPAYIRYGRVFGDIINKFLISSKTNKLSLEDEINVVEDIFNYTFDTESNDYRINELLVDLEDKLFYQNDLSKKYLSAKINLSAMANSIEISHNTQKNVLWFKKICMNNKNPKELREKYSLLYPIEKVILCEGQTEFTLLKTIFKLYNHDFDKLGYLVLQAGGKNQVARKYYQMIEYTKIPFFILLDCDALAISELIEPKLRKKDTLYLIKSGEFEDLIPSKLLLKTINYIHKNEFNCDINDFSSSRKMVENLELIYKKYGFGEFKKAQFAQFLKEYIEHHAAEQDFSNSEINKIIPILCNQSQNQGLALS